MVGWVLGKDPKWKITLLFWRSSLKYIYFWKLRSARWCIKYFQYPQHSQEVVELGQEVEDRVLWPGDAELCPGAGEQQVPGTDWRYRITPSSLRSYSGWEFNHCFSVSDPISTIHCSGVSPGVIRELSLPRPGDGDQDWGVQQVESARSEVDWWLCGDIRNFSVWFEKIYKRSFSTGTSWPFEVWKYLNDVLDIWTRVGLH